MKPKRSPHSAAAKPALPRDQAPPSGKTMPKPAGKRGRKQVVGPHVSSVADVGVMATDAAAAVGMGDAGPVEAVIPLAPTRLPGLTVLLGLGVESGLFLVAAAPKATAAVRGFQRPGPEPLADRANVDGSFQALRSPAGAVVYTAYLPLPDGMTRSTQLQLACVTENGDQALLAVDCVACLGLSPAELAALVRPFVRVLRPAVQAVLDASHPLSLALAAPAPAAGAAPGLQCHFDGLIDGQAHGWAFDRRQPELRLPVELLHDGQTMARGVADMHRADLVQAGLGDGHHHFRLAVPATWQDGKPRRLSVRVRQGGDMANSAEMECSLPQARPLGDVPASAAITVFTPYFAARTAERQAELDLCLRQNLACVAVSQLVLMIDDGHEPPLAHPKLQIQRLDCRPTYLHWLRLTEALPDGQVSILANSDIYFDETLPTVQTALAGPARFLALSRHEKVGEVLQPHSNPKWSQDVWGLRAGQALAPSLRKALDIPLGVPRCDNKIAYLFAVHGWAVHNPMHDLRSVHVHETQQRHYDKKTDTTVMGGVAYVHPSPSLGGASQLELEVWARNAGAVQSVKLNASLDRWQAEAEAGTRQEPAPAVPVPSPAFVPAPAPAPALVEPVVASRSLPAGKPVGDARKVQMAMREGALVFSAGHRFKVYRCAQGCMAVDSLSPAAAQWLPPALNGLVDLRSEPHALLAAFVPPVADTRPMRIGLRPSDKADVQFWQYPAATERQAFENHLAAAPGSNVDPVHRVAHTYLALPWATYIDKKQMPDDVVRLCGPRLAGLAALADQLGFALRVHTVCQQIHWRRLVDTFCQIGVTDLHLSHDEQSIDPVREGWPFRVHSWPLFAPNIEVPERRAGVVIGKPLADKRYLASFIGAHMPHYRSDVRLQLAEAAQAAARDDILVDLGTEWHFNKLVYQEQVQHKPLADADAQQVAAAAQRYNEVLSDSVFSLCPEGAGPNTLRIWESLAVGAIPVVIAKDWVPPDSKGDSRVLDRCVLFMDEPIDATLFAQLAAMPVEALREMQQAGLRAYAGFRRRIAYAV
ncbi:MAG: exostosin family protein [Aquabacterium sp.]|nr:exostosin family protein [Aquabacterium sp.]